MGSSTTNRLIKNTGFLYFRMFITMLIGLYSSRIVLSTLGESDYGIYNVVGGLSAFIGFFNAILSQASSRHLTYELGKRNLGKLKDTFSACLTIHLCLALLVLILGEVLGVYFINEYLVIPEERLSVAHIVFQFTLFSTCLTIMQAPYNASLISHEHFSIYAYMSMFDAAMKLGIVFLLQYLPWDKLEIYAFLLFTAQALNLLIYRIYTIKNIPECSWRLGYNINVYKSLFKYIGWSMIGTISVMLNGQGLNILLNMFFGPLVNTARGLAFTVSNVLGQFATNIQAATRPQIIKLYANEEFNEMNKLILNSVRYSSYMIFLIGIPIFFEIEYLLELWLGKVPEYTVTFTRLVIIQIFIQTIDTPIGQGIQATGKMKLPNLTSSLVYLTILPTCYIFMKNGATPEISYIIAILAYPLALICDLLILSKYTRLSILSYLIIVVKSLVICSVTSIIPYIIQNIMESGFTRLVVLSMTSSVTLLILIFIFGLNNDIRKAVIQYFIKKIYAK